MSEKIIRFDRGIPGFLEEKEFTYLEAGEDTPFGYLQSQNNEQLSFIVVSPFIFYPEYEFILSDEVKERLNITPSVDIVILSIVTIREEVVNATMNLVAPIVVNLNNLKAEQVILEGTKYSIRHQLFSKELEKVGGE